MSDIKLSEVIAPHFFNVHKDIKEHKYTEYLLNGGRGSVKSSFIAEEIIMLMKKNPKMHALATRQIKDTLKDSVYAQLVWAIDTLNCTSEFKCTKNPLEIVYKPTGQTIYFRGADDPYKIKSIKPPFGYIGILWFEELDQFRGDEQIRNIEQSVMRGGDVFYNFKSFNPPKTANNWANKYALINKPNMLVHHSTYLTVPKEWLGQTFINDAEFLKQINPKAYEHEYLGVPNGTGGNVFENVVIRTITDEEINSFDRIYMGIDWGWYPDPFQWCKLHYDSARRTLYVLDEYRANKTSNIDTFEYLRDIKKVPLDSDITADSAEQKSVNDYKSYGFYRTRGAEKGPGSVDYSMKWLQSLNAIVIDNKRTPYAATEFLEYEYEKTKDGDIISGYPDKNNHAIDSIRYAMERVWKKRGQ